MPSPRPRRPTAGDDRTMSMGGHGHGGGGGQFGGVMRSMRRDDSVTQQRVTKGTARRMIQFARPYRTILAWFLVLVVIDAVIGVVNPLLFRSIIDNGIPEHNKSLIIGSGRGGGGAGPGRHRAVHRHPLGVGQGRRGPHLRHAVQGVRAHPEDAHRLFHPDPDRRADQPAQQRRHRGPAGLHRHAVVGRLQPDQRGPGAGRDVPAVLADHPDQPDHPAGLRPAGQAGGPPAVVHHPRVLRPQRPDEQHHERALQRLGGPAGQAVRPARRGAGRLRVQGRPGPRHRGDPGHVRPLLHRRPHPHRRPGHRRGLRVGWPAGGGRQPQAGDRGGPGRLPDPAVRTAHRPVQRADRRHDRPGVLRPGLRGARSAPDDRREARGPRRSRRARPASSSTTSTSGTPMPRRCRWPHWSRWPCSTRPCRARSCST